MSPSANLWALPIMEENRELESRPGPRQRPVLRITLISRSMVDCWGVEALNIDCDAVNLTIDLNGRLKWWRGRDFHPHDVFR